MKVTQEIKEKALPFDVDADLSIHCPHCHEMLENEYDNGLETYGNTGIVVHKDPYFSECTSETTVYWKCPYCGNPIEEGISWDN